MASARRDNLSEAEEYFAGMERGSQAQDARFLRAAAAAALVSLNLCYLNTSRAAEIFRQMDQNVFWRDRAQPELTVLSREETFLSLRASSLRRGAKLTLVSGQDPEAQNGVSVIAGLKALLGESDPEAVRLRVLKNLILFCASQGSPNLSLELWEGLRSEPWFRGSDSEHPFLRVMAYASALSGDRKRANQFAAEYAKRLDLDQSLFFRALLLTAHMQAAQLAGSGAELLYAVCELQELPEPESAPLLPFRARAAAQLVKYYSSVKNFDRVNDIFRHMDTLGYGRAMVLERFRAAVDIIESCAGTGELALALSIFEKLHHLDGLEEYNFQRIRASVALVDALAREGKLREAKELYFYQRQLKAPKEYWELTDSLNLCYAAADLEAASEDGMFSLEQGEKCSRCFIRLRRANAAAALMESFGSRSDIRTVWSFYNTFDAFKKDKVHSYLRMALVTSLFLAESLPAPKMGPDRVSGAPLGGAPENGAGAGGEPPRIPARKFMKTAFLNTRVFKKQPAPEPEPLERRPEGGPPPEEGPPPGVSPASYYAERQEARPLAGMIALCVSSGAMERALGLYHSKEFAKACSGRPEVRARAAVSLGLGLIAQGGFAELRCLYESGVYRGAAGDDLSETAFILLHLVNQACLDGDLERAWGVFGDLPSAERHERTAVYSLASAFILNEAYLKARDREGVERMAVFFASLTSLEMRMLKAWRYKLQDRYLDKLKSFQEGEPGGAREKGPAEAPPEGPAGKKVPDSLKDGEKPRGAGPHDSPDHV
jgi:hypothetical protein